MDLAIAPGKVVAVVGTTGAGKSTLAQIAAGLVEPSAGTARLAGMALTEAAPSSLREHVSMVSQEVHCFATTVAEERPGVLSGGGPDPGDGGRSHRRVGYA